MSIFKKPEEKQHNATLDEFRQKISFAQMPSTIKQIAERELDMLCKMSPATAEYTIGLTYVDYLASLPWNRKTADNLDLERAKRILNERHFGLNDVKERILEHLAVKIFVMNKKPHILVVDDEEMILDVGSSMLESIGYTVMKAPSGRQGLQMYEKAKDKIDLVILDIIMPDFGGKETFDTLHRINPDVKVLLSSGYSLDGQAKEILESGCKGFIQKPFSMAELSKKIREILDSK